MSWMQEIRAAQRKEDIIVGMEPTGHYWFSLGVFLRDNGIKPVLVNPHHVKKSKELDDNSQSKNDRKEYMTLLESDEAASSRFWEMEKRLRMDKRNPGVQLRLEKRNVDIDLMRLIRLGIIEKENLDGFSDELIKRVSELVDAEF